jgi:hypothetical protein
MKLPDLEKPDRYCGLYVFDFGDWTAVGYTAEEIALLLESDQYRDGKVYKIVRANPDGTLELRGVSGTRFRAESGLFFNRAALNTARADFAELRRLASTEPPPCRASLQLAERPPAGAVARYVTALIYPAEYEDELGRWLLDANYQGGDLAEGGISHVTNYYAEAPRILERAQLWSRSAIPSRSADEVFASLRRAVQR